MNVYEGFRDRRVVIAGLGYVGLTLAVAMAEEGFQVHGIEIREDVLERLAQGEPHFFEPGLQERLRLVVEQGSLTFSRSLQAPFLATVYIITVGTPLDGNGAVRLDMIRNATEQLAGAMTDGALVILRSTVKVGTARNVVQPILDAAGRRYEIAVCPERTLEGSALDELRRIPQIVGADDPGTVSRASQLFSFLTPTIVRVPSLETAEVIKLVDNTYRDVTFAFGNEVARLCNSLGVNSRDVIEAGRLSYPRTNVAFPGPVGGPCLEKDPHILAESGRTCGVVTPLINAARWINENQPQEVVDFLASFTADLADFPRDPVISLLGLAFKGQPETDDLRGTMAFPVLAALRAAFPGASFRGFDAVVADKQIGSAFGITPCGSLRDALRGAHLALVLNNHRVFAAHKLESLCEEMARPGIYYDFWNMHKVGRFSLPENVYYISLGNHGRPVAGRAPRARMHAAIGAA